MRLGFVEKNSQRVDLKDVLPLSMPFGLCIEPTNICNFKCKCCPVSEPDYYDIVKGKKVMKFELFKKVIDDVIRMGSLKNINLYGDGEPFINKDIIKMVRYIREHNVSKYITITTNASLIDEKTAEKLVDSGLDFLRISIYGLNQSEFSQITKSNINYDQIYKNICKIKEIRDRKKSKMIIYVKTILSEDRYYEKQIFFDRFKNVADELNIETPMNWNGYEERDFISKIDKNKVTDQTKIQNFYDKKGKNGFKKVCTIPFSSLNIKSNGDVVICIVDWNRGTKVGNISTQSLDEIWNGEQLRQIRLMHLRGERYNNPSCKNCNYIFSNPDNIDEIANDLIRRL